MVHQEMKILSSLTHHDVKKEDILKNVVTSEPTEFNCMDKKKNTDAVFEQLYN